VSVRILVSEKRAGQAALLNLFSSIPILSTIIHKELVHYTFIKNSCYKQSLLYFWYEKGSLEKIKEIHSLRYLQKYHVANYDFLKRQYLDQYKNTSYLNTIK